MASDVALRDWLDQHPVTRARGADKGGVCYDTPWPQADALARRLVEEHGTGLWWGDPCCGVGRLLIAFLDALASRSGPAAVAAALRCVRYGDIESDAGELAHAALVRWSANYASTQICSVEERAKIADAAAALHRPLGSVFEWPEARGGVIITNPPFESIRSAHRRLGRAEVERLRQRFEVCSGAFDLGVPVVARCMELAQGGALGLVAPTRWLSAGYAERLRGALDSLGAWERVASRDRPFDAQVDVLLALLVAPPGASHPLAECTPLRWQQCDELPRGCVALSELAILMSGTPGFDARRVSGALREEREPSAAVLQDSADPAWRFYSAASVSPIAGAAAGLAALTHVPLRLCGRQLARPLLPRVAVTSSKRAAFYDAPKFIVPGVARTLLAAWSEAPAALSVGVVGIVPHNERAKAQIAATFAAEESRRWLRDVAPGRDLSGGFQRFPARLLAKLPVRIQ